jgi:hypothetical protein
MVAICTRRTPRLPSNSGGEALPSARGGPGCGRAGRLLRLRLLLYGCLSAQQWPHFQA